jgi:hypothetical protein
LRPPIATSEKMRLTRVIARFKSAKIQKKLATCARVR